MINTIITNFTALTDDQDSQLINLEVSSTLQLKGK